MTFITDIEEAEKMVTEMRRKYVMAVKAVRSDPRWDAPWLKEAKARVDQMTEAQIDELLS